MQQETLYFQCDKVKFIPLSNHHMYLNNQSVVTVMILNLHFEISAEDLSCT